MPSDNDPRVFFAAERTLLAWLRTAITLIGLGFVVARFGLFLQLVRAPAGPTPHTPHMPSAALGVMLSMCGALTAGVATWQQRRYYKTLGANEMPPRYRPEFSVVLGCAVASAGLVLAVELILTHQ